MAVEARFYVEKITRHAYDPEHATVVLQASGRGEQNKAWAKYTPSGEITMQVNSPGAAAWFEARLGHDLALTFTEVDDSVHHRSVHGD